MNISKLNEWLSLIANVGVLAGIFFLVTELNQTNRIAVATAENEIRASQRVAYLSAVENPEVSGFLTRARNDQLETDEDRQRFLNYVTFNFSIWASAALHYENGLLSDYSLGIFTAGMIDFVDRYPAAPDVIRNLVGTLELQRDQNVVWDALIEKLESMSI